MRVCTRLCASIHFEWTPQNPKNISDAHYSNFSFSLSNCMDAHFPKKLKNSDAHFPKKLDAHYSNFLKFLPIWLDAHFPKKLEAHYSKFFLIPAGQHLIVVQKLKDKLLRTANKTVTIKVFKASHTW